MEKQLKAFLFITFVDEQVVLASFEKVSIVALDDGGTCLIPNAFIRTSKQGHKYISLPRKDFTTKYRLVDYNRETKERKIVVEKEITSWDVCKLTQKQNARVKKALGIKTTETTSDNLPF